MLTIPTKKSHHYPALFCLNRRNNYEDSIVHVKQCEETEADKNINLNNAEQADVDGDKDLNKDTEEEEQNCSFFYKLDEVGPVDNRPSPD